MKIRSGFVSNSSSTCFLLAAKIPEKTESPSWFDVLDFLVDHCGGPDNLKVFSTTALEQIERWKKEINELEEDKKWCLEELKIYEDMEAAKIALPLLGRLIKFEHQRQYIKNYGHEPDEEQIKQEIRCYRKYGQETADETLHYAKRRKNFDIAKIEQNILKLSEKIKKAKPYTDKCWKLIGFEEDNFSGFIKKAVEKLDEDGNIVILEKIHT
jgi:hypothetical protein